MARFLVKASEFKNVCKAVNDRKLAELKKEIIEILKKQDENEVKKAIDYFNSQELHYTHLEKSLVSGKWIEKAGYGIGTVRVWKGKKYKKIAPNKWARVFEKEGRGTNIAIGKLIAKVQKIDNVEDLMAFVMANKQRFVDENGVDLPVLDKLRAAVDARNGNVGSKEKTVEDKVKENPDYPFKPKTDKERAERAAFEKDRDDFIERMDKIRQEKKDSKPAEKDLQRYKTDAQNMTTEQLEYYVEDLKNGTGNIGTENIEERKKIYTDELNKRMKSGKLAENYDSKAYEDEKENILRHTNKDYDSVDAALKDMYAHKNWIDRKPSDETEHEKTVREARLKAVDDIIEGLKNGDKKLLDKFVKDKSAEKKEELSWKDKVLMATDEGAKKELGRGKMYKKHITDIQRIANSNINDIPEKLKTLNDFIEYQDSLSNPDYKQAGKDYARLKNHELAREIWKKVEDGEAEWDDNGYLKLNEHGLLAKPEKKEETDYVQKKRDAKEGYWSDEFKERNMNNIKQKIAAMKEDGASDKKIKAYLEETIETNSNDIPWRERAIEEGRIKGNQANDYRDAIQERTVRIENCKELLKEYESEAEKHQNRSDAMKGNKNAYKGGKIATSNPEKLKPIAKSENIEEGKVKIPYSKEIAEEIKQLTNSVAEIKVSDTRYAMMNKVYYDKGNLVATDGKCMKIIKVGELSGIDNGTYVDINNSKDGITITADKEFTKDHKFPQYERVLPQDNKEKIVLDNKALISKIKDLKKDGSISNKDSFVTFDIQGNDLMLDGVKVGDVSAANFEGEDSNYFNIDSNLLTKYLSGDYSELMSSKDNSKAMYLGNDSAINIIMPQTKYEYNYDSSGNQKREIRRKDYDSRRKDKEIADEAKSNKKAAQKMANQEYVDDVINGYKRTVPADFEEKSIKKIQDWDLGTLQNMYKIANADIDYLMETKDLQSNSFMRFTNKEFGCSPRHVIGQNYAMKEHPAIVREIERLIKEKGGKIEKSLFDDFIVDVFAADDEEELEHELYEGETEYNDYSAEQPELFNSTSMKVREALDRIRNQVL